MQLHVLLCGAVANSLTKEASKRGKGEKPWRNFYLANPCIDVDQPELKPESSLPAMLLLVTIKTSHVDLRASSMESRLGRRASRSR